MEIPPEIGDLKFYKKSWSQGEALGWQELEWQFCKRGDFQYGDIVSTSPIFYPTVNTEYDLDMYSPSMRCIKDPNENLNLWGNYNTGEAAAVQVVFELCDNNQLPESLKKENKTCASDEEIAAWAEGRYIIVNEN